MPEPMTTAEEMNPYKIALRQLAHVAGILGLDDSIHGILQKPKRELTVHFPVNMESGGTRMFTGYRVQHNTSRGPAKGGLRFHPDSSSSREWKERVSRAGKQRLHLDVGKADAFDARGGADALHRGDAPQGCEALRRDVAERAPSPLELINRGDEPEHLLRRSELLDAFFSVQIRAGSFALLRCRRFVKR